jgi:aryl-alcohol dehydrogenase-like predicted oxidoreductase
VSHFEEFFQKEAEMKYREHQGERFSEIGMGCYGLSGAYGKVDIREYKKTLDCAIENGVTYFDTAQGYGSAEEILGEVVGKRRPSLFLSTKVSPDASGKADLRAETLYRACEASLKRLKTDYIDLYNIHFDDPETPVEETVTALEKLVREGKIRHYGVGHLPPLRVKRYMEPGKLFSVMGEYSVVARHGERELFPLCRRYKTGIVAFSVTGRGVLARKRGEESCFDKGDIRAIDPLFQREKLSSALRIADYLKEIAGNHGMTPVQTAIAWVLRRPGVICALTGPSRREHLLENIRASSQELPQSIWEEIDSFLEQEESRFKEEGHQAVLSLLSQPLDPDGEKAFKDLLYAAETAVALGFLEESVLMPLFYDLFQTRATRDAEERSRALERVRLEVKGLLFPEE